MTDGDAGDSVRDEAAERQRERAERVEDALAGVRRDLGEQSYPVSSEALSATYADQTIDLPNETESVGSAFGRLEGQFESEEDAYDALVGEIGGDEDRMGHPEGDRPATWSESRAETQHEFEEDPIEDEDYESSVERSRERARRAQANSDDEE